MSRLKKLSILLLFVVTSFAFTQIGKKEAKVSLQLDPEKIYTEKCASCHGEKVDAFVDRQWKHGKTKESLVTSITNGYNDYGMPSWKDVLTPAEINAMADLILESLKTVEQYSFSKEKKQASSGPAIF